MLSILQKRKDLVRFIIVGILNTSVDFLLLNIILLITSQPIVIANTISTGIAMVLSFTLNKRWSFESKNKKYAREIILFLVVTIIGNWVINNGILFLIDKSLEGYINSLYSSNISKVIATFVSMLWNYFGYKYVVFRKIPENC